MTKHQSFSERYLSDGTDTGRNLNVQILLTQGFSLLSLASMTDVFDAVAQVSSKARVQIRLVSVDGQAVASRSGGMIQPDGAVSDEGHPERMPRHHLSVVCSGSDVSGPERLAILRFVRRCQLTAVPACLIGAAVRVVAGTGSLTRGTDHWTRIQANCEVMPEVEFSNEIYVRDGIFVSCSGELGAMDYALDWVSQAISPRVSSEIRNHLLLSSVRSSDRPQCTTEDIYAGAPKLVQRVIKIMMENIELPLPMTVIARKAGVSVRQVERLFSRYLSTSPVRFYRLRQLEKARALLEDTKLSVTEISVACGFGTSSSFSHAFRKEYGLTPLAQRRIQQPLM